MLASSHRLTAAVGTALARIGVRGNSLILLGLSGGADSVALLNVLLELRGHHGFRVSAAHLNHQIRGAEADRDEAFVHALCARVGVDLICERASGLDASLSNLEERAREVRRAFLERTASQLGADFIALAHHADDQAETFLMRLLRGAGVAGLGVMDLRGPGQIIRPMLFLSRDEIRRFIVERELEFVEDSSNASRSILRNRIRHELMPMLEREYAPGLAPRLSGLADEMRDLDALVVALAARELEGISVGSNAIDVSRFTRLDPALQRGVARELVRRATGSLRRVSREHIESIRRLAAESRPNAFVQLPGRWRARREYELLKLEREDRRPIEPYSIPLLLDGATNLTEAGVILHSRIESAGESPMPASLDEAVFDAAAVTAQGLVARSFRVGDRIAPLGISGHRKLKDVFIDRKIPRERRGVWPLVTVGDEIVWLPGLIRSRAALVSPSTEIVLRIEARICAGD